MFTTKELWQDRAKLTEELAKINDSDDEKKLEKALVIKGQIEHLDMTLSRAIEDEAQIRAASKANVKSVSIAEALLGSRDEFKGLEVGFKNSVATVTSVPSPLEIELDLDGKLPPVLPDFASTLLESPAIGSVSYKQRGEQIGAVAERKGVVDGESDAAARVIYTWHDAVANKEAVSGYVPVSKDSLRDYDELESIIMNDLRIDIQGYKSGKYVNGSNTSGIVGVTNTPGIQTFTENMGGMYFDAIRMMRTKIVTGARRIPTHVAMSPYIKEAIDLYKTETGLYQALGDNTYWGMKIIEDVDVDGIIVYDYLALCSRLIDPLSIEVGYYDDQFIKRELSILGNTECALQVRYPNAICFADSETLSAKNVIDAGGSQGGEQGGEQGGSQGGEQGGGGEQ